MFRRNWINLFIKRDSKERIWQKSTQFSDLNLLRQPWGLGHTNTKCSPHPGSKVISAGLLFVPSKLLRWRKLYLVVFRRTIIRLFKNFLHLQTIVRLWTKNSRKSCRENRKTEVNLNKTVCFGLLKLNIFPVYYHDYDFYYLLFIFKQLNTTFFVFLERISVEYL